MTNLLPNQQIVLDNVAEQGFLAFYRTLSDKSDTTIRFFDRQDYYTVHGQDALLASKEFFKTSTVIKYLGSGERKVASCVLSKMNFESFIKELLLIRQYRVELYRNKSGKNNWELVGKASPGNLQQFEEVLFGNTDMSSTTVVMAVQLCADSSGQRSIGAAFADPALRKFDVCEFVDNDQFSNLEALLVQLTPKECLFNRQESNADHVKIKQVLERSNVLVTDKKKGDFNAKDITQDLNRLLKHASGNSAALPELDLASSMSCLAALIKYLEMQERKTWFVIRAKSDAVSVLLPRENTAFLYETSQLMNTLLSDSDAFGQFTLSTFDLNQYMKLDASAAKALNLFPSQGDGGDKHMCISGLLNKCKTPQGQRLELQWVKQPLLDKNKIEERLNLVEVFFENGELRQIVQEDHLRRFPDISRLAKKFQRQRATLQDCVKVYQAAQRLPMLAQLLSSYTGNHHQLVKDAFAKPLEDATEDFSKFMELVETTVDLNQVDQHEFLIKAEFDEGLQECKEKIDDLLKRFPVELNKAARDLGLEPGKTIKLESNSQLGYFFRVTLKDEKALRNNKKYFTIETRKDGCRFSNSSLKSLNEEFQSLRETYNDVQSQLANEVIKVAAGYSDPMLSVSDTVAFLDVIVSFAHVASHAPIPYSRPKVYEKGEGNIILKASRHPCLELQDDVSFIANDVKLIRGNSEFQIITGPNMGGKSTYIRQVGVISLLAQIGSFVPCEEAEVTILDSILARVGASDSQLRGVSTFMSEMLETASILRSASKDSLIIIDELGRGTSTYDGFGLAWAISEHIATKIKAFCMFATHFHELTALADVVPSVSNLHVTALTANGSLTLLYKVKSGVCDRSFGIHVAQLAHFPDKVVETAKRKARELEDFEGSLWDTETSTGDYDGDLGSLSKKRRKEKQDGEEIIEEFFQRLRHLLETEESEEEFATKLAALKGDVRSKDNSYIRQLLAK